MANLGNFPVTKRSHRWAINHPTFKAGGQIIQGNNQAVTPTGAAVAIRPRLTAIRRLDNSGQGSVGYI